MAIVAEYHFGNTRCYIDDTYVVKTKEENDQILKNVARIWGEAEMKQRRRELEAKLNAETNNNT